MERGERSEERGGKRRHHAPKSNSVSFLLLSPLSSLLSLSLYIGSQ
jgi:hypothetical protein